MSLNIVIIGGVAGGMSAATRARRMNEHASITVLEKGGYISFANCGLPYHIAGRIADENDLLVATPDKIRRRFNIDVRVHHEAIRIDRAAKTVEAIDLSTGAPVKLPYDKLILATGAAPIIPPIEHARSANVFLLRSMEDTQSVQRWLSEHHPRSVAIIGAGFIGLEMAEAMRERGLNVTVVEKAPHVLPPLDAEMAAAVSQELRRHEIRLITGVGLSSLRAREGRVHAVVLEDGQTVDADMVLLSIGVRPNTKLAVDAQLKIGPTGAIAVDAQQRTSDADIYAVGDVAEVVHGVTGQAARISLAGPANRQGRIAGEHAAIGSAPDAGRVIGTAIVKVFGLSVATTGLSERDAKKNGLDVQSAYVLPADHASYYPGAQPMRIKLIYETTGGRIIGAQITGGAGVDKRIDVIATAIHFRGTIDDLAALDLAYAPQFGSAKDAVHMAAFVAQNQRREISSAIVPGDYNGDLLLDVRTREEYAKGTLAGAVNIPLDELRQRIDQLDPARAIVTFCQAGQRGYVAQRILQQHHFDKVRNLKGGYSLARLMMGD